MNNSYESCIKKVGKNYYTLQKTFTGRQGNLENFNYVSEFERDVIIFRRKFFFLYNKTCLHKRTI